MREGEREGLVGVPGTMKEREGREGGGEVRGVCVGRGVRESDRGWGKYVIWMIQGCVRGLRGVYNG